MPIIPQASVDEECAGSVIDGYMHEGMIAKIRVNAILVSMVITASTVYCRSMLLRAAHNPVGPTPQ